MAVASLAVAASAFAQNSSFTASRTFEFDPDKTGGAVANWSNGIGEQDANGNTKFGLRLEKNVPIDANVASPLPADRTMRLDQQPAEIP